MGSETKEIFKKKKEEQLTALSKQISNSFLFNREKFKVFPLEASLGKTQTMIKTIRDIQRGNPKCKFLIVTKFMDEGFNIESQIKDALAYNSKNEKSSQIEEKDLYKYGVLIITHELYKRLCRNYDRRQFYIKDRNTLIIDEELSLLKIAVFDDHTISQMGTILNELSIRLESENYYCNVNLQEVYFAIIDGLVKETAIYLKKEMKFFYYEDLEIENHINHLIELVQECPMTKEYLTYLKTKFDINTNRSNIVSQIDVLRKFYNNTNVLASSRTLYTYDDREQYFMLNNNIMLDASASFNKVYDISEKFEVIEAERIVNHNQTTIHWCRANTSAHALKHKSGLEGNLFRSMVKELNYGDKVLVLATDYYIKIYRNMILEQQDHIQENKLTINLENFQGMRGKNDWKDYNKCFVLQTPVMMFQYYVFLYKLYGAELPDLSDDDIKVNKVGNNAGFINNGTLEELKRTDIVSTIYQGIKRVNRYNNLETDIYIANNSPEIVNEVIKQLSGVKIIDWELVDPINKPRKARRQDSYNNNERKHGAEERKKKTAEKITQYFLGLQPGMYKKDNARNEVEISSRRLFNEALSWMISNGIKLETLGIKWGKTENTFEKYESDMDFC